MTTWIRVNKSSMIRFLIFRIWRPITSFILSNLEAVRYLFKRREAIRDLHRIREELIFVEDLSFWYSQRNFTWKADPANGMIDFISKPWVSVVKNWGDCDDMMAIAKFVLKGHVDEMHRAASYSVEGGGHAFVVAKTGEEWVAVSNQKVYHGYPTAYAACMHFYGNKTGFVYIYGAGAHFPEAA